MTDAEIIKALECCINNNGICEDCPLLNKRNSSIECTVELIRDALDLINRQRAEIEELASQNAKVRKIVTIKFDEDKLKEITQKALDRIEIEIKQAKSEAIREFAEKAAIRLDANYSPDYCRWIDDTLYELVKEMVGEDI